MKKLVLLLIVLPALFACESDSENLYTDNFITYDLFKGSEFDYTGKVEVKELKTGQLEMSISLNGAKTNEEFYFPAHLHFDSYDGEDAPIAYQLNPVDQRNLESKTILSTFSNGEILTFEELKKFDGHIKVHLAESGPDYAVILVAGNIGVNDNSTASFNPEAIAVCSSNY
ncbi:hypothetical protein ACFOUP_10795 [Belliella kenyensis]|uniref:CHRD domain-containing protein n=1 Tax=Belliella kenyensis TaxID=1472724 RepID=A0ABV8EMU7_9BACT|nr:hypothetical protein [Belliella kenyensis]MCH7400442.1 hypothetical protein [Belliella kenyensis]MDN3604542.1 hypothetical protein [Belliella kenyensis]